MQIITLGVFDVLHAGHIRLLKFCRELGETVVGLNTDGFVKKYKGKPPVMNYEERKTILNELDYKVVPNDQKHGGIKPLLLENKINLIVVGSDWAIKDYVGQIGVDWKWLEKNNIGICYYPRSLDMSTTKIKERIKHG
jgi:cytidyltransferase-like protein